MPKVQPVLNKVAAFYFIVFFTLLALNVNANELRDPTTPLNKVSVVEGATELVLAAIASVGGENFAIINGQRVYKGSTIEGATIEEISAKHIVYSHKGKRYTLNMRLSLSK